jgi:2-hydroxychromene-2-carboxylate isomerase
MVTLGFELYWSFRSPYSYLATPRIVELARDYDVEVNVKLVYPLAVREPDFFEKVNPLWPPYLLRDTMRIAERLGVPYHWPRPDPIVQDYATRTVAVDQPYIRRLMHLGLLAVEQGQGLAFIDQVSRLIWSGEVVGWDQGDHLRGAVARAGLDLDALQAQGDADGNRLEALAVRNQQQQLAAGHWGVPLMVFDGEPFFGQDRVEYLIWRLEQRGLTRRGPIAG